MGSNRDREYIQGEFEVLLNGREEISVDVSMGFIDASDVLRDTMNGKLTFESRDNGRIWGYFKGPYYQHNTMIRQAEKLKLCNDETCPRYFRIIPLGSGQNASSDALLFIIWLFLFLYPFVSIGTACYCQNVVNIVSAVVLAICLVCHILCMRIINTNWKKLKRRWYVTKLSMKNYFGSENSLTEVTVENIQQQGHFNLSQRQLILSKLQVKPQTDCTATVMLVTDSYWKSKVLDPIICLVIPTVTCLIAIILQIEFYKTMPSS